nr:MAG TPA: TFIIB zinc-binding [Bacteriophage sp.]
MTESEAIKICNTIVLASSLSSPHGIPLNTTKEELIEAMKIAIQALEKQIPKKPNKETSSSWGTKKEVHTCPVCDCYLTEMYFIAPQESKIKEKITYCDACGQAIDWSDVE